MNFQLLFLLLVARTSLGLECESEGVKCLSCTEYETCQAGLPTGVVISCKNGSGCANDLMRQCQMKLSCFELNECNQNGIFPDITTDSNYFVCLGDASSGFLKYDFTCPDGNFFDKSTNICAPRSATESTTPPVSTESTTPPVSTESTTPPVSTESTTPVSTESTTPPVSTESTAPSVTTTESTTPPVSTESTAPSITTTESTTPSFTTAETTTVTTTDPPAFVCPAPGIFPNQANCKMYYRCSSTLKAFFYICPGRSYFNENILKCSMLITPACQEQILKNKTSSPTPVITTTTTPTVTSPPITTSSKSTPTTTSASTPQTTTTTTTASTTSVPQTPKITTTTATAPTTSGPFSCTTAGIFPDALDCKTYYRCSVSGKFFRYICPGNTYFNEFTKRCSLTLTPRCKALVQG